MTRQAAHGLAIHRPPRRGPAGRAVRALRGAQRKGLARFGFPRQVNRRFYVLAHVHSSSRCPHRRDRCRDEQGPAVGRGDPALHFAGAHRAPSSVDSCGRQRSAWPDVVLNGKASNARQRRHGNVMLGVSVRGTARSAIVRMVQQGLAGAARQPIGRHGSIWQRRHGQSRRCSAWCGSPRFGRPRDPRHGRVGSSLARCAGARRGRQGPSRQRFPPMGKVSHGVVSRGRLGMAVRRWGPLRAAGLGRRCYVGRGSPLLGTSWHGTAQRCAAGAVRSSNARSGLATFVSARQTWQARLCSARPHSARHGRQPVARHGTAAHSGARQALSNRSTLRRGDSWTI
jgi:hypothetical protein